MPRKRVRQIQDVGTRSRTRQSHKDECDINLIVKNHTQTGIYSHVNPRTPTYGDFTQAHDLQDALALVGEAGDAFDELPAAVRAACNNDPVQLLNALANQADTMLLAELGLDVEQAPEAPLSDQISKGVAAGLAAAPKTVPAGTSATVTPQGGE